MKKIIIFLIIFIGTIFINIKETYASTTFYQAEYIPNIYMNKYNPQDKLIYYHPARVIRDSKTNRFAYCLEPFTDLNNNQDYIESENPDKYSAPQLQTIPLIAYFGYGYKDHTDPKWYAITQMLIWKTIYPNASYYYTSTANGEKISFWEEENEIFELIAEYQKNTSFHNQTFTIVTGNKFSQHDYNKVLSTFKPTNPDIKITGNNIQTPILTTGTYEIILEKQTPIYEEPILFFISNTNQDVITIGKPQTKTNIIKVNVIETEIQVNKLDYDTSLPISQGQASLNETILSLYTEANVFIQDIKLNENNQAIIKNLKFGTYYLKEKTPGTGYTLNKDKYKFTLDQNKTNIVINIKNKVIKGNLIIKKEFGTPNNFKPEANISFNIYNHNNELIKTIVTNELGIAEITLPYGKYKLSQLTTTEGYQKIEPIEFEIKKDNEVITKELKNYKIDVPNTSTKSIISIILNILKELLW